MVQPRGHPPRDFARPPSAVRLQLVPATRTESSGIGIWSLLFFVSHGDTSRSSYLWRSALNRRQDGGGQETWWAVYQYEDRHKKDILNSVRVLRRTFNDIWIVGQDLLTETFKSDKGGSELNLCSVMQCIHTFRLNIQNQSRRFWSLDLLEDTDVESNTQMRILDKTRRMGLCLQRLLSFPNQSIYCSALMT